jgi:hypothetical protein
LKSVPISAFATSMARSICDRSDHVRSTLSEEKAVASKSPGMAGTADRLL